MAGWKATILFFCILLFWGSAKGLDKAGLVPKSVPAVQKPDSLSMVRALHQQGDSLLGIMGYREAEVVLAKAYVMAQRLNEIKLMCRIANNLAECYSMTGRHEKAEAIYQEAYRLLATIPDTNAMAIILVNLGDEYAKTGRTALAAETELKAIKLKETSRDYRKLAFYYQKLGELFIDRDNAKWEHYAMKALALSRTEEYTTLRATVAIYNDLGAIWRIKNDFVKAEAYYDTMYRISEAADYRKGIMTATSERALLMYDMGRFHEALPLASKAYEMSLGTDDDYHIVYGATLTARILLKLNQSTKAVGLLNEAAARAHRASLPEEEMAAFKYLSEAHRTTGKWEAALLSQDRYFTMKDSIDGLEVRKTLNDLQIRFETEKKQQLIDRLNEKNLAHEKRSFLLIGLLIALLLALFSLAIIVRLRNRTIRQNQALNQKEQDIHRLEHARLTLDLDYKARALTTATVHLINKNEVLSDLKNKLSVAESTLPELSQAIRQIDQNINLDNDWQNFSQHFEGVHPDFFKRLRGKFPALTPNEDRLCAYLLLNLNTKEISQMLNVTSAAVDKSRNRLRKKLDISPEVNLNEFLLQV
jgi:tetratricopeptide (TPR) repeat protein